MPFQLYSQVIISTPSEQQWRQGGQKIILMVGISNRHRGAYIGLQRTGHFAKTLYIACPVRQVNILPIFNGHRNTFVY